MLAWSNAKIHFSHRRGEPLPAAVIEQKPNVIIAAECVYFEPAFPLLMQTLKDLLELSPDAVVYFCFKKRRRADMNFVKKAKKAFLVNEIFDEDRPVFSRSGLFLFSFRSRHAAPRTAVVVPEAATRDKTTDETETLLDTDSGIHMT